MGQAHKRSNTPAMACPWLLYWPSRSSLCAPSSSSVQRSCSSSRRTLQPSLPRPLLLPDFFPARSFALFGSSSPRHAEFFTAALLCSANLAQVRPPEVSPGRVLSRLFLHARPGTPARCRARQQVLHVGTAAMMPSFASCSPDRTSHRRSAQFLFGNRFRLHRTPIRHDAEPLQHCPTPLSLFRHLASTPVPT
jgi:hypothetical protein